MGKPPSFATYKGGQSTLHPRAAAAVELMRQREEGQYSVERNPISMSPAAIANQRSNLERYRAAVALKEDRMARAVAEEQGRALARDVLTGAEPSEEERLAFEASIRPPAREPRQGVGPTTEQQTAPLTFSMKKGAQ